MLRNNIIIPAIITTCFIAIATIFILRSNVNHEGIATLMQKGFYDGCMEAKSTHKKNIGVPVEEAEKCSKSALGYRFMILESLERVDR